MCAMLTVITRRRLLATIGAATGAAFAVPQRTFGQNAQSKTVAAPQSAPTVISNPPRRGRPDAPPTTYFSHPAAPTTAAPFSSRPGCAEPEARLRRVDSGEQSDEASVDGRALVCFRSKEQC